jgi:hypothetical protein
MSDIVPRSKVSKQGVQGVVSLAGGIGAFVLAAISNGFLGIIIGGVVTVAGLLLSSSKHERGVGVVITVVGAVTVAASFGIFGWLVHGLMYGAGAILVGLGGWSLFKFFRGLKSRS